MAINIKAAMKRDERELNGLEHIVKELIDDPMTRRVVVGVIEVARITADYEDGGTEVPTVKFVQIEPMVDDAAIKAGRDLLAAAYKARTGQVVEETLFDHAPDGEPDGDGDQADED